MAACARLLPPSRRDRRTGLGRARGLAAGRGGRPAPGHPAHPRAGQWRSRSAPAQQASPPGPRRAVRRRLGLTAIRRHRESRGPAGGRAGPCAGRGLQPGKRPTCRACYTPPAGAATARGDAGGVAAGRRGG
jgi:hypothetical protein